jgi:hypothetical protein
VHHQQQGQVGVEVLAQDRQHSHGAHVLQDTADTCGDTIAAAAKTQWVADRLMYVCEHACPHKDV